MEQDRFKIISGMLKFLLLLQLTNSINQQFGAVDATSQSELHEQRMSKIEVHNQQQDKEMSLLKNRAIEDRNEIHQLRERVSWLEASASTNKMTKKDTFGQRKRPARLLPSQVLR